MHHSTIAKPCGQVPEPAVATPVRSAAARMRAAIETSIAETPFELDGSLWCDTGRSGLASQIGASEKTITRILKDGLFVTTTRRIRETNTLLVRIGEPTVRDRHRETAIILRTIWRNYLAAKVSPKREALKAEIATLKASDDTAGLKRASKALSRLHGDRETRPEFGQFTGLAQQWPDGLQIDLFKMVLAEWGHFFNAVKYTAFIDPPDTGKTYQRSLDEVHLKFPSISTILLFQHVAVELLEMQYQEAGKSPPATLIAANPSVWGHLPA